MKGKNYIITGGIDCNEMASNGNYINVDSAGKCIEIYNLELIASTKNSKI